MLIESWGCLNVAPNTSAGPEIIFVRLGFTNSLLYCFVHFFPPSSVQRDKNNKSINTT